jgi:hypothetical protein
MKIDGKFDWASVGLCTIGMAGLLYSIRTFDFDTQLFIGIYVSLVLFGLRFCVNDSQSRKRLRYASIIFVIITSIFIGLCNLI